VVLATRVIGDVLLVLDVAPGFLHELAEGLVAALSGLAQLAAKGDAQAAEAAVLHGRVGEPALAIV
jgi:hypothetical protein